MLMLDYIQPILQCSIFVIAIYIQKGIRRILSVSVTKQQKLKWRIIMMLIVTIILTVWNYFHFCYQFHIAITKCIYFQRNFQQTDNNSIVYNQLIPVLHAIVANSILFSYDIYEKVIKYQSITLERLKNVKSIIWAPLLEQILFRACFYRASSEHVSTVFLALIFSLAHFHRYVWKSIINKKDYSIKGPLAQSIFTFVFGLYSFYFLSTFHSIWPSIVLHCMCNYLGPPTISKQNVKFHLLAVISFVLYLNLVIHKSQ